MLADVRATIRAYKKKQIYGQESKKFDKYTI